MFCSDSFRLDAESTLGCLPWASANVGVKVISTSTRPPVAKNLASCNDSAASKEISTLQHHPEINSKADEKTAEDETSNIYKEPRAPLPGMGSFKLETKVRENLRAQFAGSKSFSQTATANGWKRPPLSKAGSEGLLNFERTESFPKDKAGKEFVPAWKQKSVDEISRIRSQRTSHWQRRGESCKSARTSVLRRKSLITMFAEAAPETSSCRQQEAPPTDKPPFHEIDPDATALDGLAALVSTM